MTHNRVISTQATAWLKKTILRRPFVKYYYPIKLMSFVLGLAVIIKNKRLLDMAYRGIASRNEKIIVEILNSFKYVLLYP